MKAYVKSAGRQATQDYVWKAVEAFGEDDKADREILSIAERSTANKGRVASFVGEAGKPPYRFALFFGNVDSRRCDFYGTPILNRIGFIFDGGNGDDIRLAQNLASDWYSVSSALERQIATGIIASDDEIGFALSLDFAEAIRRIASSSTIDKLRPDADQGLFESIARMARLSSPVSKPDKPTDNPTQKGNTMRIFVNTVPSGESDYGWYIGGRPPYADRLCDVCEHVAAVAADTAFFAALSKEGSTWVVFVQDIIGRDVRTNRPARGTIAIEIPDSDSTAAEKSRRLLCSWLQHNGRLLQAIKDNIDTSGDEVKANMPALLAAVEKIGTDSSISLGNAPQPQRRTIRRISQSRDNVESLRADAAKFVAGHSFLQTSGVQFLFTNFAYSSRPDSYDVLPDIPAKYIVAGYRKDEAEDVKTPTQKETFNGVDAGRGDNSEHRQEEGEDQHSNHIVLGVVVAVIVCILLVVILRSCSKSAVETGEKSMVLPIIPEMVANAVHRPETK